MVHKYFVKPQYNSSVLASQLTRTHDTLQAGFQSNWLKAESQLAILDASAEMRAGQDKTSTFLNMYASNMFTRYTHTHTRITGKWKSNMLTVGRKRKKRAD